MTVKMVETVVNGRWTLLLPKHRAVRPEWPWWEAARLAAEHDVISSLVSTQMRYRGTGPEQYGPRPVVWVAGAEEGDFPALYSQWGADVVMAEPNPKVWPNIKAIWEANGLRAPWACWPGFFGDEDRDGDNAVPEPGEWPTCADGPVIGDHGFCRVEERPDLPSVQIDTLVRWGAPPPDVLTIDVEGAEAHVLHGAMETLRVHRPHVFVSVHKEFAAHHYGDGDVLDSLWKLMTLCGYDPMGGRFLCRDHEEHWWWAP